jgi:hypothetical protein
MNVYTIASIICLAAMQPIAAEIVTSTATNTITQTVYRVKAEATKSISAPFFEPSVTSSNVHQYSAAKSVTSMNLTTAANPLYTSNSAARVVDVGMPVALAAGSFAWMMGYM